ncbi:MAG TPA: hypothetical protein PLI18_18200, partial [Pirellulaceae bacterium]|nr:hypothetical protein [Pirellulaceae bacterium]
MIFAAAILFVGDVAVRRIAVDPLAPLRRLVRRLTSRTAPSETPPSRLDRLRERKAQVERRTVVAGRHDG